MTIVSGDNTPNPKVSVAVITYNQQNTIRKTIDSILSQKYDSLFEIIIGDDCSSDETRNICLQYQKMYPALIKLIIQNSNQGIVKNFADTILLCKGEYITFCAGDDYWCDDYKLQKQVDFLKSHEGFGFVRTANYNLVQETAELIEGSGHSTAVGEVFEIAKYGPVAAAATICFERRLLQHIDFNQFIQRGFSIEDYPMQAIMAKHTKFGYIPDKTAVFRQWNGSGSHPENREKSLRYNGGYVAVKRYLSELFPEDLVFDENMEKNFMLHKKLQFAFEDFNFARGREIASSFINPNKKESRLIRFTKNIFVFYLGCMYKKFQNR